MIKKRSVKVPGADVLVFLPLDRLKTYGRISTTVDDTDLEGFLRSSHNATKSYLDLLSLSEATITLSMDERPTEFKIDDMNSVVEIRSIDEELVETVEDSDMYLVDPPYIKLKTFEMWSIQSYFYRFEVDYLSGWSEIPEEILNTMLEVATIYYHEKGAPAPEKITDALSAIQSYRNRWF